MVYHDMQYAQSGHDPKETSTQLAELRHQIRRLSSHPSISVYDGCNECKVLMNETTSVYATFVMTVVASEDNSRAVWPSCPAVGWATGVNMIDATPSGRGPLTTLSGTRQIIETHGPYLHGSGFSSVNGDTELILITLSSLMPLLLSPAKTGIQYSNIFASEFGATSYPSFESLSPTLSPAHWTLHGAQPDDACTKGFSRDCTGYNVMAERNYPCDSLIVTFFGTQSAASFNVTGEANFKRQLYLCMLSQSLYMKSDIEGRRGRNELGLIVWQYNEIWPTGGWGSIEYGSNVTGQVLGGRWKPLHYIYRRHLLSDTMITCGVDSNGDGMCYVRHDGTSHFDGVAVVDGLRLNDGSRILIAKRNISLPPGPGSTIFWKIPLAAVEPTQYILLASMVVAKTQDCPMTGCSEAMSKSNGKIVVSHNEILLAPPFKLQLGPARVVAKVDTHSNADGSYNVNIYSNATALFVTLTTRAPGRFSDNTFAIVSGRSRVRFIPFDTETDPLPLLQSSMRVDHAAPA